MGGVVLSSLVEGSRDSDRGGCVCPQLPDETPSAGDNYVRKEGEREDRVPCLYRADIVILDSSAIMCSSIP